MQVYLFSNDTFRGAFWGAVSIFVLEGAGGFFLRILDRKKKHLNSLHRLFIELNSNSGLIYDNLFQLRKIVETLHNYDVSFDKLTKLPVSLEYYNELLNIELLSELSKYHYKVRKINSDISGLNYAYTKVMDAYIQKDIDLATYKINVDILLPNFEVMIAFLEKLQASLIPLMAKIRIMQRKDVPFIVRVERLLTRNKTFEKLKSKDLKKETKKIKAEIAKSKKKSRYEINKLLKKVPNAG